MPSPNMSVSTIGAVLTFRKGVEDPAADLCELPGQRSPNGLPVVTNGSAVLIEYVRPTMRTLQRSILQQAVTKRVGADDGRTRLSSWRLTSYSQVLPDQPGHATVQKRHELHLCDLVISSDGVHSVVRWTMFNSLGRGRRVPRSSPEGSLSSAIARGGGAHLFRRNCPPEGLLAPASLSALSKTRARLNIRAVHLGS